MTNKTALSTTTGTAAPAINNNLDGVTAPEWEQVQTLVYGRLKSAGSRRVYASCLKRWEVWTTDVGIDPRNINVSTVNDYFSTRQISKSAKQRELTTLRAMLDAADMAYFLTHGRKNPAYDAAAQSLKWVDTAAHVDAKKRERNGRALTPSEADKLLRVWANDETVKGRRNQALIAVLLLTGMRRAELAALTWHDIDFERGVIRIAHGKGDKERQAAVFGCVALDALKLWQMDQPAGYHSVFVGLRKGGNFTGDKAMTTTAIYNVVQDAAARANIGTIAPHDLRRTLITELLAQGMPLADAQAQAGHQNGETTLRYAQSVDAVQRRKAGRVRYG